MEKPGLVWRKEVLTDEGIYSDHVRDSLLENDEISAMEDAFMRGWDDAA